MAAKVKLGRDVDNTELLAAASPQLRGKPVVVAWRGNLGAYLGLLTSEKRWVEERITARVGQFAGQDFHGAQHYAASFIFEPMGYALGNLFTD